MDLTDAVLSFAVLGALLTITPGLDTALVLRAAITMGRGPAFARGFLARRAVRRTVDAGTGTVLLGFGMRLGLSSN